MTRRQFLLLIVPLLAVLVGFMALLAIEGRGGLGAPPWDRDFAARVRGTMADEFVWGIPDGREGWQAYFNALNEWLVTFDPYAEVVPPWEAERIRERSSGQYGGIGIRPRIPGPDVPVDVVPIVGVSPKGPAAKAGVVVGDAIVAVEDRPVAEICADARDGQDRITLLAEAIRGPEGTRLKLRLRARDGAERDVTLTRGRIDKGSVFGVRFLDEQRTLGYIRIDAFQNSTASDFREALNGLLEDGMRGLVLDLRQNGGGLLEQAVEVADAFISDGIIVRQRGRRPEFSETYSARGDDDIKADLAMVVLVDGESASASEILAGALQDHGRAALVGERTFGKFLVQLVEDVPMDCGTALFKRTTSIYETPLGNHYARTGRSDPLAGLVPDVAVRLGRAERDKLRDIFANESFAAWNPDQEPVHAEFVDRQLQAATAVLRGETYYPRLVASK